MKLLSRDTRPEVERLHIEMIRKASISRRLQMVSSLIKTTRRLSWNAICDRYSDNSPEEKIQKFIFHLYDDKELAERVTSFLKKKGG